MSDLLQVLTEELNSGIDLTNDNGAYTVKELCEHLHCCREKVNAIMDKKVKDGIALLGYKRYGNGRARAWKLNTEQK